METARTRGRHRTKVENDIIRRREKESRREEMWNGATKYFQHWEKSNTKFEAWTSPRYYEESNKMIHEIQAKKEKDEKLQQRREKLRKLLEEDQRSYDIELMIHKSKEPQKPRHEKLDDIPTEVLEDLNASLKADEDAKRRREAELKLYHQWRINNPLVRQIENKYMAKDLKLSWLDQQIEKRMQKEKEDEECRRILKERDERIKREKENEERFRRDLEEKRRRLKEDLERQMEELQRKHLESEELKKKEHEEMMKKIQLDELEEMRKEDERRRKEKECALFNIRQHKLKLKQKSATIQENLLKEKEFILKLKELELEQLIEDEKKRLEIKQGLDEFLNLVKEQQELEKARQKHVEFIFDSEAKAIYDRQCEMWEKEECCRRKLAEEVFATIKLQVQEKIERNKEMQKEILAQREEVIQQIEEYNNELQRLKEEEERTKTEKKKALDDDLRVKNALKRQQENLKLKEIDEELERIRQEEKRLQEEILKIQRRQGPSRSNRSRLLY